MMTQRLRAVVVDDEPLARDELMFLLSECDNVQCVGEAGNAAGALEVFDASQPDVVFADLKMPGPDGIILTQALRKRRPDIAVVIVTAHDDAALRAYDAQAIDYLLKPVRLERLQQSVDRVRLRLASQRRLPMERMAVQQAGALVVLNVDEIIYCEVIDTQVWVVTAVNRVPIDLTLADLEERLPEKDFFRSHRGTLVRVASIRALEPLGNGAYQLVMDHPQTPRLPLARDRARVLKERIPLVG